MNVLSFADEVHRRALRAGRVVDQLKLQKLTFYAYGAAVAYCVHDVPEILFEAWKHGPVNVDLWHKTRHAGSSPLPAPSESSELISQTLAGVLDDVVEVYGRLSSWDIRCESHLEDPWIRAWARESDRSIPDEDVRSHFVNRKFAPNMVELPAHLGSHAGNTLDGIPIARFASLHTLAESLRASRTGTGTGRR